MFSVVGILKCGEQNTTLLSEVFLDEKCLELTVEVTKAILANHKMSSSLQIIVWLGHQLTKQSVFVHLTGYQSG